MNNVAESSFISSGSVLSQINSAGNPQYPNQSQFDQGGNALDQTNSNATSNETSLGKQVENGNQKVNNASDPTKGSNGLDVNALKTKGSSTNVPVDTRDKNVPSVEIKQQVNSDGVSADTEPKDGGWLSNSLKEMAKAKLQGYLTDSLSNVNSPESRESTKSDTSTKPSKKGSVGKIPAIDDNRPSPSVPNAKFTPKSGPTVQTPKIQQPPKINTPKFSIPKFK